MSQELGDCFGMNLTLLNHMKLARDGEAFLCHGKPTIAEGSPLVGTVYDHAWVEVRDRIKGTWSCLDASAISPYPIPKDDYYSVGKIDPKKVFRYGKKLSQAMLKKHGHAGPWDFSPEPLPEAVAG